VEAGPVSAEDFDPARFSDPVTIDNPWFPLIPGTRWIYRGSASEDGERIRHRVVFTVTDLTKEIQGVTVLVAWDRDYSDGELVEAELAFFAQDDAGHVWHLGQYPEEYDNGRFDKAPAWIAGSEGAHAGIAMKVAPDPDAPSYEQGYAPPPINWIDRARVYQIAQRTCVPAGCFDDVLVTEEFERNKPRAFQLKFYAPEVGNVRVGWRGRNEEERETLVLVEWGQLGEQGLAMAREAALALERSAYRRSEVYALTQPAVPLPANP
jgi:hypothetical protein